MLCWVRVVVAGIKWCLFTFLGTVGRYLMVYLYYLKEKKKRLEQLYYDAKWVFLALRIRFFTRVIPGSTYPKRSFVSKSFMSQSHRRIEFGESGKLQWRDCSLTFATFNRGLKPNELITCRWIPHYRVKVNHTRAVCPDLKHSLPYEKRVLIYRGTIAPRRRHLYVVY